jgi:hypothetical protein
MKHHFVIAAIVGVAIGFFARAWLIANVSALSTVYSIGQPSS